MSGPRHSPSLGFAWKMKFSPEMVLSLKRMQNEKDEWEEEGKEEGL